MYTFGRKDVLFYRFTARRMPYDKAVSIRRDFAIC